MFKNMGWQITSVDDQADDSCQEWRAKGKLICLFVCFVALHPKSTVMVMAERSVHLTTLFPGQA